MFLDSLTSHKLYIWARFAKDFTKVFNKGAIRTLVER